MENEIVVPFKADRIVYLGEQRGNSESGLMAALIPFFAEKPSIKLGYLVRLSYAETPGVNVALCLKGGHEDGPAIAERVGMIFKSRFNPTQHLDIIFLSEAEQEKVQRVAKPFYSA